MAELFSRLFDTSGLVVLYQPEAFLYLALVLFLLWVGKQVYARTLRYDLMAALVQHDNKAATVAFTGFVVGLGLALWGALTAPGLPRLGHDLLDMTSFGLIALALLRSGQWVTEHLAFRGLRLRELTGQGNLAAGLMEAASAVSTGLILRAAIGLSGPSAAVRLAEVLVFFVLGQLAFSGFVRVHARVVRYDLTAEIREGNPAIGVSAALTFIGQGIMLGYAVAEAHSVPLFAVWYLLSSTLLVLFRLFVDRLLLPGHSLDDELDRDRNWGIGLLEGASAIVVALALTGAF
jgi:uncharacterized membrane protein YjfL (UPF0719 family)